MWSKETHNFPSHRRLKTHFLLLILSLRLFFFTPKNVRSRWAFHSKTECQLWKRASSLLRPILPSGDRLRSYVSWPPSPMLFALHHLEAAPRSIPPRSRVPFSVSKPETEIRCANNTTVRGDKCKQINTREEQKQGFGSQHSEDKQVFDLGWTHSLSGEKQHSHSEGVCACSKHVWNSMSAGLVLTPADQWIRGNCYHLLRGPWTPGRSKAKDSKEDKAKSLGGESWCPQSLFIHEGPLGHAMDFSKSVQ